MLKPVLIDFRHQPDVEHLHDIQARFTGLPVDRPNLMSLPVRVALGFENEQRQIRGGFYIEDVAEFSMLGNSREASELMVEIAPAQLELLRRMGYRQVRTFIPQALKVEAGAMLERTGFVCQDSNFCHYAVDLRGGNNVKE